MFRAIAKVSFISIVTIVVMIFLLSWFATGQAAKNAGFFERAGMAADQLVDTVT